jgi:hypothetical protein
MTIVATGIVEALYGVQVLSKGLDRFLTQALDGKPHVVCPAREAVHASQEVKDAIGLVPTRFEPLREPIEMGSRRADTIAR